MSYGANPKGLFLSYFYCKRIMERNTLMVIISLSRIIGCSANIPPLSETKKMILAFFLVFFKTIVL